MDTSSLNAKLQTAVIATRRTLILGSGNKITDFEKTNGWCAEVQDNVRKNNDRTFQCYPLSLEENPLKDHSAIPYFIRSLVKEFVVILNKERVGNCGEHARFTALHLWKNAGKDIHSIEIVSADRFDHAWVIVNRKQDSDLSKPEEWGDAWIVDSWWGDEGKFYHVSEYNEKIIKLLAYIKVQNEGLYKIGKLSARELENFNERYDQYLRDFQGQSLKVAITRKHQAIFPQETPYPIDEKNMKSLEDYYDYCPYQFGNFDCRTRILEERAMHKQNFLPCVEAIKTRGYIPNITAVEEKFLKNKVEM